MEITVTKSTPTSLDVVFESCGGENCGNCEPSCETCCETMVPERAMTSRHAPVATVADVPGRV